MLTAAGCGKPDQPPPPPPPAVSVSLPMVREVVEWDEYIGQLAAVESVNVQARVSGKLESVEFRDGEIVPKDKVLFRLDARPFQAEVDRAQGEVTRAESQLSFAAIELERIEKASAGGAASPIELENRRLVRNQAQGSLLAARGALVAAQLNVEFCTVRAPIAGRIGRHQVTPGNLINGGPGQATTLTTIQSLDPIHCYVDADEASIQKYQRLSAAKTRVSARDAPIPAYLKIADEADFVHEGYVDFVDNRLDPGTGTLQARAVFDNKKNQLLPGYFGRIRVPGSGRFQATLVPAAAISTDQGQKYVLVVVGDTVQYRKVKVGALFGTLRAIDEGVGPNDHVIVNGIQRARPGGKVAAQLVPIPPDAFKATAPGSPTTQALPATRVVPPGALPATIPAVIAPPPPETNPSTQPSTGPSTQPATAPSAATTQAAGGSQP